MVPVAELKREEPDECADGENRHAVEEQQALEDVERDHDVVLLNDGGNREYESH